MTIRRVAYLGPAPAFARAGRFGSRCSGPPTLGTGQLLSTHASSHKELAEFQNRIIAQTEGRGPMLRTVGYAAPRIASALRSVGGEVVAAPEGFVVEGDKGPLRLGEEPRAEAWALHLQQAGEVRSTV
jgi:hypothetical protein